MCLMTESDFIWRSIAEDDLISDNTDLILRVEQMDTNYWWYSVSKKEGDKEELCSSNDDVKKPKSVQEAMIRATEKAITYFYE